MDARSELHAIGIAPDVAATLAALYASPPAGPLDPGEPPPATVPALVVQIALLAILEVRRRPEAVRRLLDWLEPRLDELTPYDAARTWHLRAVAAWRLDDDAFAAARALNRSMRLLRAEASPRARAYSARVHDMFGQLLHQQGMLADAKGELERALALREHGNDPMGEAITHGNLGRLCMDLGDFAAAADHLARDLEIVSREAPAAVAVRAQLLSHLGDCRLQLDQIDAAQASFDESHALATKAGDEPSGCFASIGLGRVALARGDAPGARGLAAHAIARVAQASLPGTIVPAILASAHRLAADSCAHLGELDRAIDAYRAALDQLSRAPGASPLEYADTFRGLSGALSRLQRQAEAARQLRLALLHLDGTAAHRQRREVEDELERASRDSWLLHSAGRFVGQRHIERLLEDAGAMGFQGTHRHVVVLFSDIRGFTTLAEQLAPDELVGFLNEFLGHMTRCIEQHDGMVDKFIGDAVMAVFPIDGERGARAIEAALAMQEELERLNRHLAAGMPELAIGIGLHAGEVVAGLVGSPQKREYTVIGDVVNTASRLEGMTKQLGAATLVTSDVVTARDHERFLLRPLGTYAPKGKRRGLEVFDVMGVRDRSPASEQALHEIARVRAALDLFGARAFEPAARELAALEHDTAATPRAAGYALLAAKARQLAATAPPPGWAGEIALSDK